MTSAWGMILNDGEVLLVRRSTMTSRPGQWCLPGGGAKDGETASDACMREVREETGLKVRITRCLGRVHAAEYFLCQLTSRRDELMLKLDECDAAAWTRPVDVLSLGQIMDLARLIPLVALAGLEAPEKPQGLLLAQVEQSQPDSGS